MQVIREFGFLILALIATILSPIAWLVLWLRNILNKHLGLSEEYLEGGNKMFHAKDGWYFERTTLSAVRIKGPKGEIVLDSDTWCSVIASVSMYGDTAEGFEKAQKFHNKGLDF